jgi:hypothetical protein
VVWVSKISELLIMCCLVSGTKVDIWNLCTVDIKLHQKHVVKISHAWIPDPFPKGKCRFPSASK